MSRRVKKPAEVIPSKVKNVNLLPSVLKTEPNKKMLDSTLDVMTSKGQLLPFRETFGLRNSSNRIEEFFRVEANEVRRETQGNNMLVLNDIADNYLGKVSYYDIENYFNVKGVSLVDGVILDKNINVLDLPVDPIKLTDYHLYYWLDDDIPPCRIHLLPGTGGNKFSIVDDLLGYPYATLKDDLTGRELELQNGMAVYFTGAIDNDYKTQIDSNANIIENPKIYYVYGVGSSIGLFAQSIIEYRSPTLEKIKRPWDKYGAVLEYPAVTWDGDVWDGSEEQIGSAEYVVQEKYTTNTNHWQVLDRWHHISVIRTVAKFLDVDINDITSTAKKARRPIISFNNSVKIYNWPTGNINEINSILTGIKDSYLNKTSITDQFGYTLTAGDHVVFEFTPDIWEFQLNSLGFAEFTKVNSLPINNNDGAIITTQAASAYYQVIYRNNKWSLAQNKTKPNQTPLFEFYTSSNISLETLNATNFKGGAILGFKPGPTYDPVLDKYVEFSIIESKNPTSEVVPNLLKFVTDVDKEFTYIDSSTEDLVSFKGPYGYKVGDSIVSFYQYRKGLDFTKQVQDLLYTTNENSPWEAEFQPLTQGFDTIHVYYDDVDGYKFYYDIEGYGLTRFSSKLGSTNQEQVMPLVSGNNVKIVCHDLPHELTLYKTEISNNITQPVLISSDYITNNGIANGVIEINLTNSVEVSGTIIDNILSEEDTKLYWKINDSYKIAYVKSAANWNFLQSVHVRDLTYPVFNGHDYTVTDITLDDGSLDYNKNIVESPNLKSITNSGDKLVISSVIDKPSSRTAPYSLTLNPLNQSLSDIGYYSIFQHAINIKSQTTNIKKFTDIDVGVSAPTFYMGGGTLLKHNDPLTKFAVTATNMPYDLGDLLIKQGKHYDSFLGKLKAELSMIIDTIDTSNYSSLEVLDKTLSRIYIINASDDLFWSHSNMIGWGEAIGYKEADIEIDSSLKFSLADPDYIFDNISHRTGKETILHITYNGKILTRGYDYWLNSSNDEYNEIEFRTFFDGKTINIKQWYTTFRSLVPASLAKIGLAPVYKPEIYLDNTYGSNLYFIIRHDGTRYYIKDGIDSNGDPINLIDYYLYEYEKAVWSSIAYDVENNTHDEITVSQPGYFRSRPYTYQFARQTVENETRQWMLENNIFVMENDSYNASNGFTFKYQLGSGDGNSLVGSWRALYKYMYDTDRPHSHPWEMLGYTIKPEWWDSYYSWTDSSKRIALKKALRVGKVSNPAEDDVVNPNFARCIDIEYSDPDSLEDFPVGNNGNLIPPNDFSTILETSSILLSIDVFDADTNWEFGDQGPYEQVFLSSHRGLAAQARANFLLAPAQYVNLNWVPGQVVKNEWQQKLDRTTKFWQDGAVHHDYHRKEVDGELVYTGGIESLYSEFCVLNNKDYETEVINKFSNISVQKEFLLAGFTNKSNVRIKSTSIATRDNILYVPEENYQVRTVKHYPEQEIFYSGMRIIFDGTNYSVNGFAIEQGYFPYYRPAERSDVVAREIGNIVFKEKINYTKEIDYVQYGDLFDNRQSIYDFIIGYGKYLEDMGFVYEEPEAGDIRNWQLSAKQFAFWSNDLLAPGNYIDLNPCADFIKIITQVGQLENLEGTNENVGQCVDRFGRPLFSKDLLVSRDTDYTIIKTKKEGSGIYGLKMVFVIYESVAHLDSTSIFGDIYFDPSQSITKRSFFIGGKKSTDWTGAFYAPGYVITENELIPNLDTLADLGRTLIDVESVTNDSVIHEASRSQFGLNRNPELRQLFLEESNEVLFKNAITFNKGTSKVFNSLNPLTHQDESNTVAYEEYMVRLGEFGNTKNIEYYEFELLSEDIKEDTQIVKFVTTPGNDVNICYVTHDSGRWVYKPYNKNLNFGINNDAAGAFGLINGDTDLKVENLEDITSVYEDLVDLWVIPHYSSDDNYTVDDKVRYNGKLYQTITNTTPGSWTSNSSNFIEIPEPYLPNIYVSKYPKPAPNLTEATRPQALVGQWQIIQTMDKNIGITEICPGPADDSMARITTTTDHTVSVGDYICIVNSSNGNIDVDGIWKVEQTDNSNQFYIGTRIIDKIYTGKVFLFKPVRFTTQEDFEAATEDKGYVWQQKYEVERPQTPSGFNPKFPISVVGNAIGNKVYQLEDPTAPTVVKEQSSTINLEAVEHLIVYDYAANKTIAKLELFNPETLHIPSVFKDDIDVIGRVDPAKYNRTTDNFKSTYSSISWYEEYVGRRWWNTSNINFADYNSSNEKIKAKYWGTTSNNAVPEIYEWTKSTVHPSTWKDLVKNKTVVFEQIASGEAYIDDSLGTENYHWVEEEDYANGNTSTVYYFWVKNKNSIPVESQRARTYTTNQLSKVLLNPSAAGMPWWSPMSSDTIILKGVKPYLNNNSTVIQIKAKTKGEEKHQQWLFVSEGNTVETIPEWLHIRLRDSISAHVFYDTLADYDVYSESASYNKGQVVKYNNKFYACRVYMNDLSGNVIRQAGAFNLNDWYELIDIVEDSPGKIKVYKEKSVPDVLNLHRYNRLGNTVRPYIQSWFDNIKEARRTFIKRLNDILLHIDITELSNWGNSIVNDTTYTFGSYQIDMTKYWDYADYRSESYNSTNVIVDSLNGIEDLNNGNYAVGDYIKINLDGRNYVIYEKAPNGGFNVVYRRRGAIQFNEEFELYGWDSYNWDSNVVSWDYDINILFNGILDSIRYEIFTGRYLKYYSSIMCSMFRYVLSEQVNVDWLTKSSTFEPVNLIAQNLTNKDTISRDEINTLTEFFSSVKSYRDKSRSGTINKISIDQVEINVSENFASDDITDASYVSSGSQVLIPLRISGAEEYSSYVDDELYGWDSHNWDSNYIPWDFTGWKTP